MSSSRAQRMRGSLFTSLCQGLGCIRALQVSSDYVYLKMVYLAFATGLPQIRLFGSGCLSLLVSVCVCVCVCEKHGRRKDNKINSSSNGHLLLVLAWDSPKHLYITLHIYLDIRDSICVQRHPPPPPHLFVHK